MRFQKVIKRVSAFSMALLLMVFAPIGNYFQARDVAVAYASATGISTAARWIWAAILAACGVTVDDETALDSISEDIAKWCSQIGHLNEDTQLITGLAKYAWGDTVEGMKKILDIVKEYFSSKSGYGTDAGIENIPVSIAPSLSNSYSSKYGYDVTSNTRIPSTAVYFNSHTYFQSGSPSYDAQVDFFIDFSSGFRVATYYDSVYLYLWAFDTVSGDIIPFRGLYYIVFTDKGYKSTSNDSWFRCHSSNITDVINACPFPVYETKQQMNAYLKEGVVGIPINGWSPDKTNTENVPVDSKPAVQSRPIQQAGALRVPATMEEAYAQYINFSSATTADEVAAALSPSLDITYGDDAAAGEDDKAYPWVPDITGALGAIKDVITGFASPLTGIENLLMDIPGKLVDIYNGVISIPEQIAAFFTIDTTQINTAQVELVAAFKAKFPALYGLSDIFNFSREFTDTIPVISIPVPDFLKFAYPNEDRIIIFDLTAYKEWFDFCRNIISAILWIAFIRWLLEQFDVKFGVN